MKKKIYCFDLDGVINKTIKNKYKFSTPIKRAIKKINEIYFNGNKVIIFTARFMGRSKEKSSLAKKRGAHRAPPKKQSLVILDLN